MKAHEILYELEKDLFDPLNFLWLGYVYSDLFDCRLNLYRGVNQWAVVAERLGYSQKGGYMSLSIQYFGNCIKPIITQHGTEWDQYEVFPITFEDFTKLDGDFFSIRKDVKEIKVRDTIIPVSQDKNLYRKVGIEMNNSEDEIGWCELGRYLVIEYSHLFRATDEELNKYLPEGLEKILVLDEWYHKDYVDAEDLMDMKDANVAEDYFDRHGPFESYETYPMLAEVLATGNPQHYKPSLKPNTHWSFWPESGSL
ncbi:MAG: hypothetical protein AAGK97_12700 [Bacteroidota bacterium]